MFDVGFTELMVIGVVALLVIGPEKLPRVARTLGALMGRAQRYVNDVKADINREIELDELRKLKTTVTEAAASIETSVRDTVSSFEAQASELNKLASVTDPVSGPQPGAFEDAPAPAAPTPDALAAAEASIREAVAGDLNAHAQPAVAAPAGVPSAATPPTSVALAAGVPTTNPPAAAVPATIPPAAAAPASIPPASAAAASMPPVAAVAASVPPAPAPAVSAVGPQSAPVLSQVPVEPSPMQGSLSLDTAPSPARPA